MVEDAMIRASSPAHKPSKENSVDLDDGLGPVQFKAMTGADQFPIQANGERGLNEVEDKDVCSLNEARFEATVFPAPHSVSSCSKSSCDGKNSEHRQIHVFGEECDQLNVKDIWVDEGVPIQHKSDLGSRDSAKLEAYQLSEYDGSKTSKTLPDPSSDKIAFQADANYSLDFESLFDQAEVGTNRTQMISDFIADKSFLTELIVSSGNPFLEDSPFRASEEGGRESAEVAHLSNPFDSEGAVNEAHDGVVIAKPHNPFLDTPSFRAAKDACSKAEKVGGEEPGAQDEEIKTPSDKKPEAPSIPSSLDSGPFRASDDKKTLPDIPANAVQLQHDPLESSFASMNPYPPLVSYSGQIPFSGSMSLRSESSVATSNRSFAFPVLQTEWNASPVKMAKANRRQLRKQGRWRHTLLCCNFRRH
uniref:Uncharacterized protein n=2 Tax=Kalanchoe fedtschenkoi TaxID=63787 RepID=A0A7N0T5V2_KALFE